MAIPTELLELPQWVAAGPDKQPIDPKTGRAAKVNERATWGTYAQARAFGTMYVGFVLSVDDPYTIIDLDDKADDPATPSQKDLHFKLIKSFDSYTEQSLSGRGFHIVIRGRMPGDAGRNHKPSKVEAYSNSRYMVFTGNVVHDRPIVEQQQMLELLVERMSVDTMPVGHTLVDVESHLTDRELFEMAANAANGDKFDALCNLQTIEDIQEMGYTSQSEADLALLSILAYYTQDNQQVYRLFRSSNLGKRDKAIRDTVYLDRTMAKIRAKQPPRVDLSQLRLPPPVPPEAAPAPVVAAPVTQPAPAPVQAPAYAPTHAHAPAPAHVQGTIAGALAKPPGLLGEIMDYSMQTIVRPVPEVALAAALGLMGGICGRSFNYSHVGLNQYIVFTANTGIGKEGIANTIERLLSAVSATVPNASQFMGPGGFASGQALIRLLDHKPCFVSILGEFGLTLQQLNDKRSGSHMVVLKKVILDLYAKSGWGSWLRGTAYSDKEKNTHDVHAPSVTILGESTPQEFYASLDATMITSGMLPRFSIIEYTGDVLPLNPTRGCPPPVELVEKLSRLVTQITAMTSNDACYEVPATAEAQAMLTDFFTSCDKLVNDANKQEDEAKAQIWSRAGLKALKLAALVAVGNNFESPMIDTNCIEWALQFVRNDAKILTRRLESGDIGQGEVKQESELQRIIRYYFETPLNKLPAYVDPKLHAARVIPYDYIRRRARVLACFREARDGAKRAIQSAIKEMVDCEQLDQIPPLQAKEAFGMPKAALYAIGQNWH